MTVSTTTSTITHTGNGATTSFTFPFIGVAADDIEVSVTNVVTNVSVVLSPTTYTLVLNAAAVGSLWGIGGTVTYPITGTSLDSNNQITITRILPFTQTISISNQGAFYPQVVEQALDKLELQIQQVNTDASAGPDAAQSAAQAAESAAEAAASATSVSATASLWSRPVLSILGTPPGSPSIGDRYLIPPSGTTGIWVGHENNVTEWGSGLVWLYSGNPKTNQILSVANTDYRWSQEAQDSGIAWRPAYYAGGGPRGVGEPADEPGAIESVSQDSRPTSLVTSSFGSSVAPTLHFHTSRGSTSAPSMPLSGASLGSIGYRAYDSTTGTFAVSSAATIVTLTENARASNTYSGCSMTLETTKNGGGQFRRPLIKLDQSGQTFFFGTAGTSSSSFSATGSQRWMYGPEDTAGIAVQSDNDVCAYMNRNTSDGTVVQIRSRNVVVGTIAVTSSATAYNTSSDERLKTPVVDNVDTGEIIDSVSPKTFTWNTTGKEDYGFFAQELHRAVPRAVTVGSEAGPGEEGFEPWSVDNSKLVSLLWTEIQDLRKRVKALEAK